MQPEKVRRLWALVQVGLDHAISELEKLLELEGSPAGVEYAQQSVSGLEQILEVLREYEAEFPKTLEEASRRPPTQYPLGP